jgi:hypothetical protein
MRLLLPAIEVITVPHRAFLAIGGLLGLAFVVATPPLMVPDENAHLMRAVQISEFRMRAESVGPGPGIGRYSRIGGYMPEGVSGLIQLEYIDLLPAGRVKTSWERLRSGFAFGFDGPRSAQPFDNTAAYPPVAYIPQAVALACVRAWHGPVLAGLYFARLLNLGCYLALVALAIRRTQVGATALAVIALLPMGLSLAASMSCDSLMIGCGFVVVAFGLNRPSCSDRTSLALRIGCGIVLAASKFVYMPLLFLGMLDMLLCRRGDRRNMRVELVVIGVPLLAAGAWAMTLNPELVHFRQHSEPWVHVDVHAQVAYVVDHPLRFAAALWNTVTASVLGYAHTFVGVLGWLTVVLPGRWTYLFAYAIGLASLFANERAAAIKPAVRAASLLLAAIVFVATQAVLYVVWSGIAAPAIDGFQGRYLFPIAPAVVMALSSPVGLGRRPAVALRLACLSGSAILGAIGIGATLQQLWVL